MVAEGSVLSAHQEPVGTAVDVAPEGFAHPVYRAGFSLSLKLPNPKEITAEPPPTIETAPPDSPLEVEKEQATNIEETAAAPPEAQETQEVQEVKEPAAETPNEESERSDHEI